MYNLIIIHLKIMAFTQSQKNLLDELTYEPENFLSKIKGNTRLMNSFKEEFYQDGSGVYHIIFKNALKNKDIYFEIFKEFFYKSNVDLLQFKGRQPSAVNYIIKEMNDNNKSSKIIDNIFIDYLKNGLVSDISKSENEWYIKYAVDGMFRYIASNESLLSEAIFFVKNQTEENKNKIDFMRLLTDKINSENFSIDSLKIFSEAFTKEEIQNAFDKIDFTSVPAKNNPSKLNYVNPLNFNILQKNYTKIRFFHSLGINLDVDNGEYVYNKMNSINAVKEILDKDASINDDIKDIIKNLNSRKKLELLSHVYYKNNFSKSNHTGVSYMLILDEDFTKEFVHDFFDKSSNADKVTILIHLLNADKDHKTLSLLNEILEKFKPEFLNDLSDYKKIVFKSQNVQSFYNSAKWMVLKNIDEQNYQDLILDVSKNLNKLDFLSEVKKNVMWVSLPLLRNKNVVKFFIEEIGYESQIEHNTSIVKNIPFKLIESIKTLKIQNLLEKHSVIYEKTLDVLKYIFDNHKEQYLIGSDNLTVLNMVLEMNDDKILSWFNKDFCKYLKENIGEKTINFNIYDSIEKNSDKKEWTNFISNLNDVGFKFINGNIVTFISQMEDEKILQKICDDNKDFFVPLLNEGFFWIFFPDDKKDFVEKNIEKYQVKLSEDVLSFLIRSDLKNHFGLKVFLEISGLENQIDIDGNNLLHLAIKKKDYRLTKFLAENYPQLAEQSNRQKKIPIEYLFNFLDKTKKDKKIKNAFETVLMAGVSKNIKTHEKIASLFDKYEFINNLYPELQTMFNYKKMDAITKKKESVEKKFKI